MGEGRLAGQVALITGGGTGIGKATALAYAREGADVAVNYSRSQAEAEATAKEVEALGVRALAIRADVASDAQVRAMFDRVKKELGSVQVLVNNAGRTHFIPARDLDKLTEEIWDEILAVNVKGTFFCSRAAAKHMRSRGSGCIVNVTSIAGVTGQGSSMAYAASKGAMINLTKGLAVALAPEIRVNGVAPSVVMSRWVEGWEEFTKAAEKETPLGRNATPEDVAQVILSLTVSADFVTGQNLVLDGGRLL